MKLLIIYNIAPLYRDGIFSLIDKEFDCDWIFGEGFSDIKQLDYSKYKGKVTIIQNKTLFHQKAYWQKNVIKQLFDNYTHYVILGEERCISTWLFLLISKLLPSKKIYFWTHGPYGKEGLLKKSIQQFFYRLVNGTFIYGNYSRDILISRGIKANKIFTIHNSLNYNRQIELRLSGLKSDVYKRHFGNDDRVLIFIGRLTPVKQLDRIIEALFLLQNDNEYFNLVFVGDGVEKERLIQLVLKYKLNDRVWFYGACYNEKTNAELIYNADLCVAPGNVGLTAMHTMVFGTPVVTHDNFSWQMPEFEAIISGKTGAFFKYEDTSNLAKVISNWFSQKDYNRQFIRENCFEEIDSNWNPNFQINVFKSVLR